MRTTTFALSICLVSPLFGCSSSSDTPPTPFIIDDSGVRDLGPRSTDGEVARLDSGTVMQPRDAAGTIDASALPDATSMSTPDSGEAAPDPCLASMFCGDCVGKAGCGWCPSSSKCQSGTSAGPRSGTCMGWEFSAGSCPGAMPDAGLGSGMGDPCRTALDCSGCVQKAGCGWCASTDRCESGTTRGPSLGTCPVWGTTAPVCMPPDAGSRDATSTNPDAAPLGMDASAPGPDAQPIIILDGGTPDSGCGALTACSDCASAPNCGWCGEKNDCEQGSSSGPDFGFCRQWAYLASACMSMGPNMSDPCASSLNCGDCTPKAGCGWCASLGRCESGSSVGPTVGTCPVWDFILSACGTMGGTTAPDCSGTSGCGDCASRSGCGYCLDDSTCVPGNQTGPTAGACTRWAYTPSSCGTTMVDPCQSSATCSDCAARSGCGFCSDDQQCRSGTSAGPANGACTNWAWSTLSCGSDPCNTSGACGDCTLRTECGWCATDNLCRTGNATGPTMGTCPMWDFVSSSCTGSDPCSVSASCGDCSARATCGWCATTNSCLTGGSMGPATGTCAQWAYTSASCPQDPCLSSAQCSDCLPRASCGWCNTSGRCETGTATGPMDGSCPDWTFAGSCPMPDPCATSAVCGDCTARLSCGWCQTTGQCETGSATGPTAGTCAEWDFSSSSCPADPCASSSTCGDCSMRSGCGWCRDDGACHSGGSAGPTSGSCVAWDWLSGQCP